MRSIFFAFLFLISASSVYAGMNLSVIAGEKYSTGGDLKPGNEQFMRGVRFDFGDPDWFANVVFDYYNSKYQEMRIIDNVLTDIDISTEEIRIGLRKYIGQSPRLYIGGGVASMSLYDKRSTTAGKKNCYGTTGINLFTNGVWAETGVDFVLAKMFIVGISASYSDGHIKCDGEKLKAGGITGGVTAGFSW